MKDLTYGKVDLTLKEFPSLTLKIDTQDSEIVP